MRGGSGRMPSALAVGALLSLGLSVTPAQGLAGNAGVQVTKTVDSTSITPALALTLVVDQSSAIPGDTLGYSGQVTNTGAAFGIAGHFVAGSHDDASATVASYFDEVEMCVQGCGDGLGDPHWVPYVGFSAVQPGYTPVETAAVSTGLTLTASPVPASGVTYSGGSDTILGTQINAGAVATWAYQASIAVSPEQIARLSSFNPTESTRNRIHFEVVNRNTNAAEPWTDVVTFPNPFQATPNPAAVRNATVTVTPPSGPKLTVDSSTMPGLALLAPGASASYTTTFTVAVPAARGSAESDSTYVGRLTALEGSLLTGAAAASGTAVTGGGTITAPAPPPVNTREHLPIVGIAKSGPPQVDAGTTEINPLALQNSGGATASGLVVTDSLPAGGTGTVTGVPASMVAAGTANAEADFPVPAGQPAGSLTDTASVSWHDANGNAYGPVSSSFTTTVVNSLTGATLTLAPVAAGPNPIGTSQRLTATLVDAHGAAIPNQPVAFAITGANPGTSSATTDPNGAAVLTYTGANHGSDVVQATVTSGSQVLQSNTSTVTWITPPATVSTTPVQGNFFSEPASATTFVARPGDTPAFGQSFPNVMFDPPSGIVNHNVSGVGPTTRPFTDVTTDSAGNFVGTIVAQGGGVQAGVGGLSSFDAVFTSSFVVARAGDVTFNVIADDGFLLGVAGGATRVSGTYENPPASNTSPFNGYTLVGAFDQQGGAAPQTFPVTVHFPAPGTYPYELDFFECCGQQLSLAMTVATFTPDTSPLSVYVGYADCLRPAGSIFPFPWQGSPGVASFIGSGATPYDSGALRFDNNSDDPIVFSDVSVDIGSAHFDLWGSSITVAPHTITILTQTVGNNFDTSDQPITCTPTGVIPRVHVTQNGVTTTFSDTGQVLNTKGIDPPSCGRGNESIAWTRIGGGGSAINVPLPPATTLTLSPTSVGGDVVGTAQPLTVAALDGSGQAVPDLPVTVTVFGANTQQLTGTTGAAGTVQLSYTGTSAGTDTVVATAFVSGLRSVSNSVSVPWSIPVPGGGGSGGTPEQAPPAISAPSPASGTVVSTPLPISATFTPPAGESIASWSVRYQGTAGVPVTLASGTGTPPSPLATFDPTLLANDTYAITISATASGGGMQTLATSVAVTGGFKPGRYVTTYQDLVVPVNGLKMTVQRTYDSTDKRVGDFGVGWHVDLSNVRVTTNGPLGSGSWSLFPTSCTLFCTYGFASSTPHFVTVTYPDGHQEVFDFTPSGGVGPFYFLGTAAFSARPGTGTTSTLVALDSSVTYGFDGTLQAGLGSGAVYNPTRFQLTTRDGKVLVLDTTVGLVSETDRNGNALTIDGAGVHASNGQSITFTRDAQGRITDIGGPATLHYDYSAAGDLAGYVDARGNQFTYSYDGNHDLVASASGGQPLTSFSYDAGGRLVAITDANGNTTTVANDVAGHKQIVTDPLGLKTTVSTQDDLGNLVQEDVIAGGRTTSVRATYDSASRPTSYTDAAGSTTTMKYDSAGNLTAVTDPFGHTTRYTYDAFGDMLTVTDPTGSVVQTNTYDANGNLTKLQRADGTGPSFVYDAAGRATRLLDPLGNSASYGFDSSGHLASTSDPLGRPTSYRADALGRVTSVTNPAGTTAYTYDGAGNVTTVRDARGGTWQLGYDALGRLVTRTDPLGNTTGYRYDPAGNVVQQTNRLGQAIAYTYDADGRLVRESSPTGDTTFGYDAAGRLVDARNETADLGFAYDDANRVVSETSRAVAGSSIPTVTFSNTYDSVGNRLSRTGPDGTTTYSYDLFNQLTAVTDPAGGRFTIGRDSLARFASLTRPNGVTDALGYDLDSHLTSRSSSLGASTLASAAYGYDASGQRTSATDPSGTSRYAYDASGNLTSATHPVDPTETYTYDAAANRVSSAAGAASYDAGDHLLSDPAYTYAWDAEGRLVSRMRRSSGEITTFTWNTRDQLTAVQLADGTSEAFRYDPLGRRVEISSGGAVTRFAYDGSNIAAEYDGGNALTATYEQLPGLDQPLEMVRGGQRYYYLLDGQGSVTGLTDAAGSLVATYRYDSFGRPTASTGAVANPFTYTGREYDARTGLSFNRARWYDPGSGQFLSEDPNWKVNPYVYTGNSPVNFEDRAGTELEEYATLIISQYKRALGIARLDRCLWLCVVTGLNDFQGLPSDQVNQFITKAFQDFFNSQVGYNVLPDSELKGPEVAESLAETVVSAMQLMEAMSGDGEMTVTEISTITVTKTTALYSYSPPFLVVSSTSYSQTTITTRQVPNPGGGWLTFAELGLAAYKTYETFNGEC